MRSMAMKTTDDSDIEARLFDAGRRVRDAASARTTLDPPRHFQQSRPRHVPVIAGLAAAAVVVVATTHVATRRDRSDRVVLTHPSTTAREATSTAPIPKG